MRIGVIGAAGKIGQMRVATILAEPRAELAAVMDMSMEKARAHVVSIFILPPSMAELKQRLKRRAEDSDAVIETRLANARSEIEHWREYDYVVINDDLDRAYSAVRAIVQAERLRRDRRPGLFDFVSGLLDEKLG